MRTRCPVLMKGCKAHGIFPADRRSEVLDLYIGDRSPLPLITHEAEYAWSPQYLQPLLCRLRDANEGIATKQWGFHLAPPVAPLVDLLEKREKREDSLYLKLLGNPFFLPRPSMDCVPVRFFRSRDPMEEVAMWIRDVDAN